MSLYKIADLYIEMNSRFEYTNSLAEPYLTSDNATPIFKLFVDDKNLADECAKAPHLDKSMVEHILLASQFYAGLIFFNGMMIHSSAINYNNRGYLFSAPQGKGKSTHTKLWQSVYGSKVQIFNDDRPAIRIIDDTVYAYGTPFAGGTLIQQNIKVPLDTVVFLEQSAQNSICKMENKKIVQNLIDETTRLIPAHMMNKVFDVIEVLLDKVNFYELKCNMDKSAAILAHDTIIKDE